MENKRMSAANPVRMNLEQRIQNIEKMPWSENLPIEYENFSHDCRFAALQLADKGNFSEAFSVISLLDSIWETPSDWPCFYIGIAKAILIQSHQREALSAIRDNEPRIKLFQKIVKYLPASDATRLLGFLKRCKPLRSKL
jgi:hypothetical protein